MSMSVESILRQKGADVRNNSSGSQRQEGGRAGCMQKMSALSW